MQRSTLGLLEAIRRRWHPLHQLRPFIYIGYPYLLRLDFQDGATRVVDHLLQAVWFRLIMDVKVADLRRQDDVGNCRASSSKRGSYRTTDL
jgi:hypothetical protein